MMLEQARHMATATATAVVGILTIMVMTTAMEQSSKKNFHYLKLLNEK